MKIFLIIWLQLLAVLPVPAQQVGQRNGKTKAQYTVDSLNAAAFEVKRKDVDQAMELLQKASRLAEQHHYKSGIAAALLYEAGIYHQHGYTDKALSAYYKSLEISREIKDTLNIAKVNQQIGDALVNAGNLTDAEALFVSAKDSYLSLNDHDDVANIYNSIGLLHLSQGRYGTAEQHFRKALKESQKINYRYGIKKAYYNLGQLYLQKNKLKKAFHHLNLALAIDEQSGDKYGLSLDKNSLAMVAGKEGNYREAVALSEQALEYAETLGASQLELNALDNLISFYKALKNDAAVIKWQDALVQKQREIRNEEKSFTLNFLEILEEKQKAHLAFEKQVLEAEQRNEQMYVMLIVAGLAALGLLLLAYMWYKNYLKAKGFSRELFAKNELIEQNAVELDELNKNILKHNESLEQANVMKGKLFSIISHDLRGPIASVKGMLNLIARKPMPEEEVRLRLGMLGREVEAVLEMLNSLLVWSKAQLQGAVLVVEPLQLHQLAEEVMQLAERQAQQKEIALVNLVPAGTIVTADKERLSFVLRNLLMNAIKFTYAGGQVKVYLEREEDTVAIVVEDNGMGITKENLEKLFQERRYTTIGTAREKGTGLGLMFSKDFVESLGGNIKVKSERGEGSAFYICLPQSVVAEVAEEAVAM